MCLSIYVLYRPFPYNKCKEQSKRYTFEKKTSRVALHERREKGEKRHSHKGKHNPREIGVKEELCV